MMLVVTGVSTLIHLYSVAYMGGDRGYARFFAYLNFFVFSMLVLVLAGNFLLLIVGWAFVGAASLPADLVLVPAHDGDARRASRPSSSTSSATSASCSGTFFIFRHSGTLDFLGDLRRSARGLRRPRRRRSPPGCILLLVGAFAKSAQIPLHTWLPDAMEGPTPVSALIHAATMVTAGVYLIARMHPLFEQSRRRPPTSGAIVGCVTLLVAGDDRRSSSTDLKRVIAYSTMSQIGYMIMAVSAGAYVGRALPPHDARLLQGAALHGRRLGHRRDGAASSRWTGWAASARRCRSRSAASSIGGLALAGVPPLLGLLLQGRDPRRHRRARRLALDPLRRRLHRRVPDRASTRGG